MELQLESELEKLAIPHLKLLSEKYCWQVPINNRVIDFAAIDKDGNLFGIEFKLNNWRRAIKQAEINLNGFDYIYICLPDKKFRKDIINEAKRRGIGILILTEENKLINILKAERNSNQWLPKIKYIKQYIMERG